MWLKIYFKSSFSGTFAKSLGISGNSVDVLSELCWNCCKLCHIAAECSWAFRRSSATLAVNKTSLESVLGLLDNPSESVSKLGVELESIEETGVAAVEKMDSGSVPNLGGQQAQGKPGIPKKIELFQC